MRIIRKTLPHFKPRLRAVFSAFKSFRWEDGLAPVLLHGTYRLNHIFLRHGELALLDLDSLRLGHPAYDVANFLSSLYYLEEAHGRLNPALRREISRYFLEGYAEKMPHAISPAAVLWFLASLLINKQAKKYVTHSHENCAEKVERMLALAETILTLGRHLPPELTFAALWQALP
jgi:aminoglycoside phosphotransferase (APT) family kinase protein